MVGQSADQEVPRPLCVEMEHVHVANYVRILCVLTVQIWRSCRTIRTCLRNLT